MQGPVINTEAQASIIFLVSMLHALYEMRVGSM